MTSKKKLIACALISEMTIGVIACDDSEAVPAGSNAPTVSSPTTQASTTTDPNKNAATDQELKILDTSTYTPDGNTGTIKYLGYYDVTKDQKGTEQCLIFQSEQYGGKIDYISTPSGV